jgi:hypothetical protein
MKTPSRLPKFLCLALALAWMQGAQASTVFWGSQFNDLLFDSNGQPLDTSYSFEIGSFGAFVPTYQNVDQWAANWKVFDRAFDPDANGWNAVEQFFVGTVDHNALGGSDSPDANPADVFVQGEQAYLWVFNSKTIVPSSEWALVADTSSVGNLGDRWIFPDPADPPGTSYDWQLGDADQAIIGGANSIQGDGTFFTNPGTFSLQTAVVPEPGSALLLIVGAAAFLTRRTVRRLSPKIMA